MPDRTVIEKYFQAMNAEDWEGAREIFVDDAGYHPAGGRRRQGIEEIVAFFPKLFAPWREHVDTPVNIEILVPGRTARADVHFTGTLHDGREFAFDAVDDFTLRDGRIESVLTTYDVEAVRAQMSAGA